jgi:hypothetical protein
VVLRLFARSHDARALTPHVRNVPAGLRDLLARALSPNPTHRPPAGEWQRALRQVLAEGALNGRYPGPVAAAPAVHRFVGPPQRATVAQAPFRSPPASRRRPTGGRSLSNQQPLTLAWLVVLAVVFALILARLVAAVTPQSDSSFGSAPSGGGVPNSQQYYYPPPGPGVRGGFP